VLWLIASLFFQIGATWETPEKYYGPAEPAEVADLAAGTVSRRPVITRGVLGILETGKYYSLQDGAARVAIIGMPGLAQDLGPLVGTRVEVKGYVRELVEDQGTCRFRGDPMAPQSVCDHPELPPKPNLTRERSLWPRTSITIWSISDISPLAAKAAAAGDAAVLSAKPGEKVRVQGRFGGANLGHELSSPSPEAEAWVLLVEQTGIWVVGKPPRGPGFRLDPQYRGDLGKWLEVEGRMAVCGAAPCLKAGRVVLSTPPSSSDEER
jgi:hypothetical protein